MNRSFIGNYIYLMHKNQEFCALWFGKCSSLMQEEINADAGRENFVLEGSAEHWKGAFHAGSEASPGI